MLLLYGTYKRALLPFFFWFGVTSRYDYSNATLLGNFGCELTFSSERSSLDDEGEDPLVISRRAFTPAGHLLSPIFRGLDWKRVILAGDTIYSPRELLSDQRTGLYTTRLHQLPYCITLLVVNVKTYASFIDLPH